MIFYLLMELLYTIRKNHSQHWNIYIDSFLLYRIIIFVDSPVSDFYGFRLRTWLLRTYTSSPSWIFEALGSVPEVITDSSHTWPEFVGPIGVHESLTWFIAMILSFIELKFIVMSILISSSFSSCVLSSCDANIH